MYIKTFCDHEYFDTHREVMWILMHYTAITALYGSLKAVNIWWFCRFCRSLKSLSVAFTTFISDKEPERLNTFSYSQ